VTGEATSPGPVDPKAPIAEQTVEVERGGQPMSVRYSTGLFLFGTVALAGCGAALTWGGSYPAVGVPFMAFGAWSLAALIRTKRIGERALVIDGEGIAHTGLWGTRYRVPWSEVTGVRPGGGGLQLRAPRSRYRVPPQSPRRERGGNSLLLPSALAISNEDLVRVIRPHLSDAEDDEGEPTSP